ncbi:chemotaxis protein CheA [Geobacter sp.]|uniref:chemotaxis protein CheA n=1 Tax=Geobacter sp. TaxID=46610 RepID=UPI0027BAEC72|nr:chemotaxis protein CheA [Geobacter sp.]
MDMSPYREMFIAEARENLERMGSDIVALEKDAANADLIGSLFRSVHSIKGMAASMEYQGIGGLAHRMEDLMDRVRKGRLSFDGGVADLLLAGADLLGHMIDDVAAGRAGDHDTAELIKKLLAYDGTTGEGEGPVSPNTPAELLSQPSEPGRAAEGERNAPPHGNREEQRTVRVRSDLLDRLVNMAGELVTCKNRLTELGKELESDRLRGTVNELAGLVRELRNEVMAVRMLPFGSVCEYFPRMVRDLARQGGKQASLVIEGKDQELDRGMLELLTDPLVHILRNAVDHGIESPVIRAAAGKDPEGRIGLTVRRQRDHILVTVEDDGRGMDPEALVASAVAKGLIGAAEGRGMGPQEALMLSCLPGFSTAGTVTDVSGRGVGMDAVQAAVRQVGGALAIGSELGKGSRVTLRLPLTVAIIQALLVACGNLTLAVPVTAIHRTVELEPNRIRIDGKRSVFDLEGETVPLVGLGRILGSGDSRPAGGLVPVIAADVQGGTVGFAVDSFLGQTEVFVKPLGRPLDAVRGLAGAAILGDGRVVFILDVSTLVTPIERRRMVSTHQAGNGIGGKAA